MRWPIWLVPWSPPHWCWRQSSSLRTIADPWVDRTAVSTDRRRDLRRDSVFDVECPDVHADGLRPGARAVNEEPIRTGGSMPASPERRRPLCTRTRAAMPANRTANTSAAGWTASIQQRCMEDRSGGRLSLEQFEPWPSSSSTAQARQLDAGASVGSTGGDLQRTGATLPGTAIGFDDTPTKAAGSDPSFFTLADGIQPRSERTVRMVMDRIRRGRGEPPEPRRFVTMESIHSRHGHSQPGNFYAGNLASDRAAKTAREEQRAEQITWVLFGLGVVVVYLLLAVRFYTDPLIGGTDCAWGRDRQHLRSSGCHGGWGCWCDACARRHPEKPTSDWWWPTTPPTALP